MLVALVTLKYTQSNSICLVYKGQAIGIGAGQQSRIHCTKIAAAKAREWFLRRHPKVLSLPFRPGIKRPERDNAISQFLAEDLTEQEQHVWLKSFTARPDQLSREERDEWLSELKDVALGSDGYIPFRDNVDQAATIGTKYIVQPGGSLRDDEVVKACDEYGMIMVTTGHRFFHH